MKYRISNLLISTVIILNFNTLTVNGQTNPKSTAITTNPGGNGATITIEFYAGKSYTHPTMAIWVEDIEGNYLQTLYVSKSLATGVYSHADAGEGRWKNEPGIARRPATLPYYLHKRNVKAPDGLFLPTPENPIPDAYTGATPKGNFTLTSRFDQNPGKKYRIVAEINQAFDWNTYWNNSLYPDDRDYKTSGQPAVVYAVTIDTESGFDTFYLNPAGHSHYSGIDGRLYTDLSTLTTALTIVQKIAVKIN